MDFLLDEALPFAAQAGEWLLFSVIINFLFFKVIVYGVFARSLGEWLMKRFKKHFIKTTRESAIWQHNINHALKNGHIHKSPVECRDGQCAFI